MKTNRRQTEIDTWKGKVGPQIAIRRSLIETLNLFCKILSSYNSTVLQNENYRICWSNASWRLHLYKQVLFLTLAMYLTMCILVTVRHNHQIRFAMNGLLILPNKSFLIFHNHLLEFFVSFILNKHRKVNKRFIYSRNIISIFIFPTITLYLYIYICICIMYICICFFIYNLGKYYKACKNIYLFYFFVKSYEMCIKIWFCFSFFYVYIFSNTCICMCLLLFVKMSICVCLLCYLYCFKDLVC